MGCIYKITNKINGKVYIGQTSESIEHRWEEHKYAANYNKHKDYNCILHRAIRKYGPETFDVILLEEIDNHLLNSRETYWINYYDSYKSGYNMTLGGEGARTIDYNEIYSLWDNGFGIKYIAQTVGCSEVQTREILKGYSNYSKRESNKRGTRIFAKIVIQYDLNGNFIAKYFSATEASNITGINKSNILATCRFEQKTAGGYQWRFDGDYPCVDACVGKKRAVKQFYLDGTLKAIFLSITDAANSLSCSSSAILNACLGKTKSSHGYLWRFVDDELNLKDLDKKIRISGRRVIQYTLNGEYITIFNNIYEAAIFMHVSYEAIYNACRGTSKSSCGFIWKFE